MRAYFLFGLVLADSFVIGLEFARHIGPACQYCQLCHALLCVGGDLIAQTLGVSRESYVGKDRVAATHPRLSIGVIEVHEVAVVDGEVPKLLRCLLDNFCPVASPGS
jgi:hypothetical protein